MKDLSYAPVEEKINPIENVIKDSKGGWIMIHRKMMEWEWYGDTNVTRLFLHLLLLCNHENLKWRGQRINRGQTISSYPHISKELDLTTQTLRTCFNKLKSTGELTVKTTNKWSLITINNYDYYQQSTGKSTVNQQTTNRQLTTNNNDNNDNNISTNVDMVSDPASVKSGKPTKNTQVDFILNQYKKKTGDFPTDKFPRRVAHNIIQITQTLIKDVLPTYPQEKLASFTVEMIVEKSFDWYFSQLGVDAVVTRLETVKNNIRARFYDKIREKYIKNYKLNSSPNL